MKYIVLKILVITGLFLYVSCEDTYDEEECYDYDYSDCNTTEPDSSYLNIDITINKENKEVAVAVFRENIESGDTVFYDTITDPRLKVKVPLNQYYSAKAIYKVDEKEIIAVHGDKIKKKSTYRCDSLCWDIKGGFIDVRLKFDEL